MKQSLEFEQRGGSLLVVLVLIVAIGVLSVSATSDTLLQFQMVRNNQFYTGAYLSAYSEINAQLGIINSNETTENDTKVLEMLAYDVGKPYLLESDELASAQSAFDQEVEYKVTCDPDYCPSPPGYTISELTKVLRATLDSRSSLEVSGATSDQSQAFWYLLPQTDLITFD